MRHLFCVIVLSGFVCVAWGQETLVLDNNAHLKWYQVNTSHFKIIYPKGFEAQAQRMANTLEFIHGPESRSLGANPQKISLILQSQSAESNGFVSITPRRSEFYGMPSQNYNFLGNNDWLDLLASHEYRHIVQFQHSKRGFNRLFFYLMGNNALAGMANVSVPQWFWEGDAVATETAFTGSGRGRIPAFDLVFRTNLQEGRAFNYDKQVLRSYKHNIPNHYVLGFHMTSYLRRKMNDGDVWGRITKKAWTVPFLPFPFSRAIKKESGLYVKDLYRDMATTLQKEWKAQTDSLQLTSFERINTRTSSAYTDYQFPQELEDGSILVMKSGIGDIETFVALQDGKEKKVFTPGPMNSTGMLSVAGNTMVWNEFRFDPRWRVKNYSAVISYERDKAIAIPVSKHSRYGGAALSPDGKKVATIETKTDYQTKLVVLDINGWVLKEFDNPQNDFISMPHWTKAGDAIIALSTNKKGKAIIRINYENGAITNLTEHSEENVGYPVPYENFILFNSPRSGLDNIYALDTQSGKRYQITSSKYGSYNPMVTKDGKNLYYNEQGRDGMDVVKIAFDPASWKEVPAYSPQPGTFFQHLVEQEGRPDLFDSIPSQQLPTKRYSQLKNLINPYSWGAYFDNSLTRAEIGLTSRDVLSTTAINAGYTYDVNERTGQWNAGVSYQGFYPILDFKIEKSQRSVDEGNILYDKVVGTDTTTVIENLTFKWEEQTVKTGIRLPLVLTNSRFIGNFTVSNYVGLTSISDFTNSIDGGGRLLPTNYPQYIFRNYADKGTLVYNQFSMSAYRLLKRSRRDINSKWGQAFFMHLYGTPYGGDYSGSQFSFYTQLYFPGLFKHHSFWGYWGYQKTAISDVNVAQRRGLDNYTFRNQVPLPRGLSVSRFENFYSMSANYTLPLWYPDIHIGPFANVQRVRANAFLDYGFGSSLVNQRSSSESYVSTGVEVKLDINVIRLVPQFDIGFRYSYGLSESVTKFEFLIGSFNF